MTDFIVEFDFRKYTMFFESSTVTPDTIEVKVIMYSTVYHIYKDKTTKVWQNHPGKFELSKGLLEAVGHKLDNFLQI
ncbi:MAG: hypothetical protein H7Y07_11450 [Pyrinomonadaceae bacterium]|nr:hypothetical protein [Sphingobacteriaceae bacterium]